VRALLIATATATASALALPSGARADGLSGSWREGPVKTDFTVGVWSPKVCGPPPVSQVSGGGEAVTVTDSGDELSIAEGKRVFRTTGCYDELPTLSKGFHSHDAAAHSWRTQCTTPANDPRKATINTLVTAPSPTHIDIAETGRYEIVLEGQTCIADVHRSRALDLIPAVTPQVAPAEPPPAATQAPAPVEVPPVPPPKGVSCDSPGPPARLEVRPSRKLLRTGESFPFHAVVLDANGCATGTPTTWTAAPANAPDASTVIVDGSGRVTAPIDAKEGNALVLVTAGGRSARVVIDVTSAAHYDELLARSGLNAQGENDAASIAELATGSIGAGDARAEDTARERRMIFIAIVGGLALALGVVAVVFARRQKRVTELERDAEEAYEERVRQTDLEREAKRDAHEAAVRAHKESLDRAQEAARAMAKREAENRAGGRMLCPTCAREYPKGSVFCPQDATKLVPLQTGAHAGPATGTICPACKRGFPAGTKVCPQDGEELLPYAMHGAIASPGAATPAGPARGKICPTCGGRFDGAATFCGKDGTALVLLN
jgi:hypothetical protein